MLVVGWRQPAMVQICCAKNFNAHADAMQEAPHLTWKQQCKMWTLDACS